VHPPGSSLQASARKRSSITSACSRKPFSNDKGGYVITKKNGKVKEVFASKAKEKRFDREDRKAIAVSSANGSAKRC